MFEYFITICINFRLGLSVMPCQPTKMMQVARPYQVEIRPT